MRWTLVVTLAACSEYVIDPPEPPPTAEPPGIDPDADFGQPPEWSSCTTGYHGQYYNLTVDDPDVEPAPDAPVVEDPTGLDWWDPARLAWRRYDGGLDFGANWWPVDEGFEGDPAYFAVRWTAWIRVWDGTTLELTLGSADDGWVLVDGSVVAAQPGVHPFEPATFAVSLESGQYPLDIRMAQRAGEDSAFRFRVLSGDVTICYPEFTEE